MCQRMSDPRSKPVGHSTMSAVGLKLRICTQNFKKATTKKRLRISGVRNEET